MWDALGDGGAGGALISLRLRSRRALLCLGGRSSFAILRTWISEKEPEDCRKRGSRLRALADALWGVFAAGGLSCHSSDRPSSHSGVVVAMVAVVVVEVEVEVEVVVSAVPMDGVDVLVRAMLKMR
jgi:hypothetical protein